MGVARQNTRAPYSKAALATSEKYGEKGANFDQSGSRNVRNDRC